MMNLEDSTLFPYPPLALCSVQQSAHIELPIFGLSVRLIMRQTPGQASRLPESKYRRKGITLNKAYFNNLIIFDFFLHFSFHFTDLKFSNVQ